MIHPILDEYSTPNPSFSRTSKFAKSKGLVSTAPGRVESVTPAGEMSGGEGGEGEMLKVPLREGTRDRLDKEVENVRERLESIGGNGAWL